jgi:hypothetical protein
VARFALDENFEARTAIELRSLGHDVATAAMLNVRGTPDYRLLLVAVDDARIVITHNIDDFLLLHCIWQSLATRWSVVPEQAWHPGILGMTQYTTDAADYAQQIHEHSQGLSIAGEMYVYRPSTGWQLRNCL